MKSKYKVLKIIHRNITKEQEKQLQLQDIKNGYEVLKIPERGQESTLNGVGDLPTVRRSVAPL